MLASLSAAARLALFVLWTLSCMVVYLPLLAVGWRYREVARLYWRMTARHVLQAELIVRGDLSEARPLLCASNHMSYLDIVILGGVIPGSFVSKAEVKGWPGIGFIAVIGRTVFVERRSTAAARQRDEIAARLMEGEPLILFPEGTSSDGNRVLPFKSSLFNVVEKTVDGRQVTVQPVSVAYTRHGGLPMGYAKRPFYAWYGDMDLAPHLWDVLRLGRFTAEVEFHAPVTMESFKNRKDLARWCEARVREGVERALHGGGMAAPEPDTPAAREAS